MVSPFSTVSWRCVVVLVDWSVNDRARKGVAKKTGRGRAFWGWRGSSMLLLLGAFWVRW